jgi:hypothetical protein
MGLIKPSSKTIIIPTLDGLLKYIRGETIAYKPLPSLYTTRFIVQHKVDSTPSEDVLKEAGFKPPQPPTDVHHSIRIWQSKVLLNTWYNIGARTTAFIGALDYTLHPDHLKIEHLRVNDEECQYYLKPLTKEDATKVRIALMDCIIKVAVQENKSKVLVDVHRNLRLFKKYYIEDGFQPTDLPNNEGNVYWTGAVLSLKGNIIKDGS